MTKRTHPEARIFSVDTRFQQLAKRGGGVSRERAIAQAQAEIEEVKVGLDEWLDGELRELTDLVKKAEAGGAKPELIEAANFHSRQLRDVGATMGCELISFIADSLCAVLDAIAAGEYNSETISCHIDALNLARQRGYRRLRPDQVPELTKGLHRVAKLASM